MTSWDTQPKRKPIIGPFVVQSPNLGQQYKHNLWTFSTAVVHTGTKAVGLLERKNKAIATPLTNFMQWKDCTLIVVMFS